MEALDFVASIIDSQSDGIITISVTRQISDDEWAIRTEQGRHQRDFNYVFFLSL